MARKMKKQNLVKKKQKSGVGSKINVEKLTALITLESKGKLKKPLTNRQKHKLMKLKRKQDPKKSGQTVTAIEEPYAENSNKTGKIELPHYAAEMSSNWKKLQQTSKKESRSQSRKRKLPPEKIRNPKLRKLEDRMTIDTQTGSARNMPEIWFDDVDEFLIEGRSEDRTSTTETVPEGPKINPLVKPEAFKGLTKAVAMDCEMVGVGDGTDSMVARVSIVNQHGEPVYDRYVTPMERVVDYRTQVSGIRPGDLEKGEDLKKVQKDVADILKGRILVGHAIQNDLKVLFLEHPRKKIRDTSRYKGFRRLFQGRTPSLKNLSSTVLHVQVQEGEHNSVQDAQAAMRLYTMFRKQWEAELKLKRIKGREKAKTKT